MDRGWFFWTSAKTLPLIAKTPGGLIITGGEVFIIRRKGLVLFYMRILMRLVIINTIIATHKSISQY